MQLNALPALSCDIPVFRYALERWAADDYELIVYYAGELSASSQEFLKTVDSAINPVNIGSTITKGCNLRVVRVNLNQQANFDSDEDGLTSYRQYWKENLQKQTAKKLPYAVLRSSRLAGQSIELWQGALEQFKLQQFLQSPLRRELCKRLLRGDAVVWLVIQSRQSAKNAAVRKLLNDKSRELSQKLELPEGIGSPGSELYADVPLLIEFSILEVDRTNRQESYLLNLFSKLDPEATAADEPLIIPVFGRGRALEVIPGNQLDAGMVGDLAVFLSGACSCQVKERNPGFDLLLNMNWHKELFGDGLAPPPPDEGLKATKRVPTLLEIPSGKKKSTGGR